MLYLKFLAAAFFACSAGAYAQDKETKITEKDGSKTVVKTDEKGTIVTNDGKAVYTSGGDRHQEQVDHSKKTGGTVTSDKR